jgi:hypothetical protein
MENLTSIKKALSIAKADYISGFMTGEEIVYPESLQVQVYADGKDLSYEAGFNTYSDEMTNWTGDKDVIKIAFDKLDLDLNDWPVEFTKVI